MIRPLILGVYTSAKGSRQKKRVFRPGDSIQWNVFHILVPPLPLPEVGQPIQIRYFIQKYGCSPI